MKIKSVLILSAILFAFGAFSYDAMASNCRNPGSVLLFPYYNTPACRSKQARSNFQECGFSRTVRSEQSNELPFLKCEFNTIECGGITVLLNDFICFEKWGRFFHRAIRESFLVCFWVQTELLNYRFSYIC